MNNSERAQLWKEMAARREAQREAQVTPVPVTFEGFTGKAHRLPLMAWGRGGRLPQYLAVAMFASVKGKVTEVRNTDLTPEEMAEWLRFQKVAFCSMMDEPRFSVEEDRQGRALDEDEIDYAEFATMAPEVVRAAVQWQLDGCPNLPILTEGGEMSLEDLTSFREGGGWTASPESGFHREGVWWDTKPTVRP
jgi:hypothetical protein